MTYNYSIPNLIMLIGIPGSGKSYWVKKLKPKRSCALICPDEIRKEVLSNISDQSENIQIWAITKERTIKSLESGIDVILDATNVNSIYRKSFLMDIPDCRLHAILFECDPERACSRIASDLKEKKDRSEVPEEVIYRMYGEFLYTKKVISNEGFHSIQIISAD